MQMRHAADATVPQAGDRAGRTVSGEVPFRVGVAHEYGGVRVRPIGEVDLSSIGRLRERTNEAMAAGADRVVLDLRATSFLDSTGLHLALDIDTWAARNRTEFVIIAGPPAVQHAFDAAALSARLPLLDGAQYVAHARGGDCPERGPRHEQPVRRRT